MCTIAFDWHGAQEEVAGGICSGLRQMLNLAEELPVNYVSVGRH